MAGPGLLENKVVFITGGGSGIGRATALRAAAEGAAVAVADLVEAGGHETVGMVEKAGGRAFFTRIDVANASSVKAGIDAVIRHFGRIDCAFNNAGVSEAPEKSWDEATFDWVISINLKGVMLCMKYELEHMAARGSGSIVNTSSIMGVAASQGPAGYIASKHGVLGLTKMAALQYAEQKIRVNAICPGVVRTPMVMDLIERDPAWEAPLNTMSPINRMAEPVEMAEAVIWLLSDRASYVTGHPLLVDGGFFAR